MTLKIYGISASRAARPLWAALELGVPFEHIAMTYKAGATRTPEFLALNPNGHIPVVVDERPEGTVTVWESMACALYIARVHGQADGQSITPANAREEAEALRWSFWTVTELEKDALTVLMHRMAMPQDQRKPELAWPTGFARPRACWRNSRRFRTGCTRAWSARRKSACGECREAGA